MQCIKCSHKNPGTVAYCQRCGAKLDFTADEIQGALIENKREEIAHSTEFYAKQALTFAAAIFLVAATCLVLSMGAPEAVPTARSEEHTSELQSLTNLVCRLLLE